MREVEVVPADDGVLDEAAARFGDLLLGLLALQKLLAVAEADSLLVVVSITQQIDLSGPVGRMVASVMFGLAEIELEYRRERQQAGIAVAKNRGVYRGRQKGTTKSKPPRARQLRKQGLMIPEIANAVAVSERTVFRYLK